MPDEDLREARTAEVVVRGPGAPLLSDDELNLSWRVASALAKSGMFKDAKQAEQALAKILLGRDLGLSPTQAMTGIHLVEGKPMVAAVTLASFVKRADGYDYRVLELTDEKCRIDFSFDGESLGVSEFSMEDAKRAKLMRDGSGWTKYPKNMLFARALSNGVKWFCPDATHGIPVYHEGELGADMQTLTGPGEIAEPDYGDDPELERQLRHVFAELEYTPAKRRTVLRGCATREEREKLLAALQEQVPQDAEVVEEPGERAA